MGLPGHLPWLVVISLILSGLHCGNEAHEESKQKRDISNDQPRMTSSGGNLIFQTASDKSIEFRTGSYGKIKLNNEDFAELSNQIQKNKDDIAEMRTNGGMPQNVSYQISQLNARLTSLEGRLHDVEQIFQQNACSSNPCQNAGTCLNLLDAFYCLCPSNWQGPVCLDDVNECQIYAGTPFGCQNGGTCTNSPGSYSCTCTPEWDDLYCTSKYDDCKNDSAAVCKHGICIDADREQPGEPKYTCVCDAGWTSPPGSPACTADIDECTLPNLPCSQNPPVQCFNTLGSYYCGSCLAVPCGGTINATSSVQTLTSPGYPGAYPTFTVCNWTIDAPAQEQVKISVQAFHLEANQDCSMNYVEFKDWPVGDYGQVHRYCGTDSVLLDFYTYDRTAVVTFRSDEYSTGNGVSFTAQIAGCNREFNQSFGYLKSPGWPNIYPNNVDCTIILRAPQSHTISLFFDAFDLEQHSQCNFDYLEVRNGSDSSAPLIGKYCGSALPNPIFPKNHILYMRFKSDFSSARNGFEITWTSSSHECGGVLFGDHGSFTSPEYPGTYGNNTDCEWRIRAPSGRVITITFVFVSIDDPGNCVQNYLTLYNVPDATSPVRGPYCGIETNIAPFTSSSNQLFIRFHADYATLPSGFRLTWST